MNNFSFEPLKLKLATNNIIIPMENGVADLTNAETSAKIMLAGKELFPIFDESIGGSIGGRNLFIESSETNRFEVVDGREVMSTIGAVSTGGVVYANPLIIKENLEPNTNYTLQIRGNTPNHPTVPNHNNIRYLNSQLNVVNIGKYLPDYELTVIQFKTDSGGGTKLSIDTSIAAYGYILRQSLKLEKGNNATDWTPAPEGVLQLAALSSYNCSAAIVGDLIKITSHTPDTTRGWVDVTVNYGNLSNTKRLNWSVEGVEPYKPLGTLLTMNNRGLKL